MIPAPILKWVATLTNNDLRLGYVEALEWLYEAEDDPAKLPLMTECAVSADPCGVLDEDDIARAILLECAGRWVYDQDSAA